MSSQVYQQNSRTRALPIPGAGDTTGPHPCRNYLYNPPPPQRKRTRAQFETTLHSLPPPPHRQVSSSAAVHPTNFHPGLAVPHSHVSQGRAHQPPPFDAIKSLLGLLANPFLPQQGAPFSQGHYCNLIPNHGTNAVPSPTSEQPPTSARTEPIRQESANAFLGNPLNPFLAQQATPIVPQRSLLVPIIKQEEEEPLGLDFDPAKLKMRNESAIRSLYADLPRQCATCGTRFKTREEHSNHMDMHLRKNRESKNRKKNARVSRPWFSTSDLILSAIKKASNVAGPAFKTFLVTEEVKCKERAVSADFDQTECFLCKEAFEDFWSEEEEDWLYRGAVYMNMPFGSIEGIDRSQLGPIVHAKCIAKPGHISRSWLRKIN